MRLCAFGTESRRPFMPTRITHYASSARASPCCGGGRQPRSSVDADRPADFKQAKLARSTAGRGPDGRAVHARRAGRSARPDEAGRGPPGPMPRSGRAATKPRRPSARRRAGRRDRPAHAMAASRVGRCVEHHQRRAPTYRRALVRRQPDRAEQNASTPSAADADDQ